MNIDPASAFGTNIEQAEPEILPERRVRIILEENENIPPTGQFFGHNGKGYMLRANEEADVPQALIDILNHAVQDIPIIDPMTQQVIGYKRKLRFPYTVIRTD